MNLTAVRRPRLEQKQHTAMITRGHAADEVQSLVCTHSLSAERMERNVWQHAKESAVDVPVQVSALSNRRKAACLGFRARDLLLASALASVAQQCCFQNLGRSRGMGSSGTQTMLQGLQHTTRASCELPMVAPPSVPVAAQPAKRETAGQQHVQAVHGCCTGATCSRSTAPGAASRW